MNSKLQQDMQELWPASPAVTISTEDKENQAPPPQQQQQQRQRQQQLKSKQAKPRCPVGTKRSKQGECQPKCNSTKRENELWEKVQLLRNELDRVKSTCQSNLKKKKEDIDILQHKLNDAQRRIRTMVKNTTRKVNKLFKEYDSIEHKNVKELQRAKQNEGYYRGEMERLHDLGIAKDKRNKELMDMWVKQNISLTQQQKQLDELKDQFLNKKSDNNPIIQNRRSERLKKN